MEVQALLDELGRRFRYRPTDGLQLLTLGGLLAQTFDPGMAVLLLPTTDVTPAGEGFAPAALPGRQAHGSDPAAMLRALYPPEHTLFGLEGVRDLTAAESTSASLAEGARWIPPVASLQNVASPHALPWLVARLRAPDGCPWDREQDHLTLRKFLLEETYEVYDALDKGSSPDLAEELGDLLLQIVLHAEYAAEAGVFDMSDVYRHVVTKIVRRHPHVFGDAVADSAAEVIRNWEQIKAGERGGSRPADADMPAAFAGLSRSLPALAYAQEMQERAASLGYDWPSVEGVLEKVTEEAREVAAAGTDAERTEELGDLLLVVVNLSRRLGVDAESALRSASAKFAARFAHVERMAGERDVELRTMSMDELDELWQAAKVGAAGSPR